MLAPCHIFKLQQQSHFFNELVLVPSLYVSLLRYRLQTTTLLSFETTKLSSLLCFKEFEPMLLLTTHIVPQPKNSFKAALTNS